MDKVQEKLSKMTITELLVNFEIKGDWEGNNISFIGNVGGEEIEVLIVFDKEKIEAYHKRIMEMYDYNSDNLPWDCFWYDVCHHPENINYNIKQKEG